ncbi:MAG: DUF89 family protein [Deltaproteobacteria bacterium]|nr:DUF89 family protein [Deltaproteobacteria bacterium]
MHTYLECLPCFMDQIVRVSRLLKLSEEDGLAMLREFGRELGGVELADPPPKTSIRLYQMISRYAGVADPFAELKEESTAKALALYPRLQERLAVAERPLSLAAKLAAAGNVIDFGVASGFDLEDEIERVLSGGAYGHWQEDELFQVLERVDWLLYLGDNSGETVFDRLFIETLIRETGVRVDYVVREQPIINDATLVEARAAGLDHCATLMSSGCAAPGTVLELCSPAFRETFRRAPLIISKGQGNYETLSGVAAPIFFILKAKCPVVAGHLGVGLGELNLVRANTSDPRP